MIEGVEDRILVCDAEANGLLYPADRIWCITAIDASTEEEFFWGPDEIEEGLENLQAAKRIVFHNLYGYDYWLFKKLYPQWDCREGWDTLVMSCLLDADRQKPEIPHGYGKAKFGTHSIEAWGLRFGLWKPSHEDWTQYTEEMGERCRVDTRIGLKVYKTLLREMEGWDWGPSLALEHQLAKLHGKQVLNGVLFDREKANSLKEELEGKIATLEEDILKQLPNRVVPGEGTLGYSVGGFIPSFDDKTAGLFPKQEEAKEFCLNAGANVEEIQKQYNYVSKVFVASGDYSKQVKDWLGGRDDNVGGPFCRFTWEEFNLNSQQQIKEYLLSHGWTPDEWNYKKEGKYFAKDKDGHLIKTSPKLTESSFHTVEGNVPKLIARRAVLKHRLTMLSNTTKEGKKTGWLNTIRPDGRIEAGGLTTGTPTGRYKHFGIVNVPKPTKDKETGELVYDPEKQDPIYGTQLRELFTVPEGKVMVGCDAVSLETSIQSHYIYNRTNGRELAHKIMDGSFKEDVARVFTKPWKEAKSAYYAIIYGAKIPKFSETLGVSIEKGGGIYNKFWQSNPALNELKQDLEVAYKSRLKNGRSFIRGLDGRKLWIRNPSAAMNMLFQNAGSVLVKTAICYAAMRWEKEGIDVKQLIVYHDEVEVECWLRDADKVCHILKWAFVKASKHHKLNVPVGGDPVVGRNWAEVH